MAGSSAGLHEPAEQLAAEVVERHRAIVSLMEELEAIDWYDQRSGATGSDSLHEVLVHNRDEEKEHAAMLLEWLRRHDTKLDEVLHTYLFTEESIVREEAEAEQADGGRGLGSGSLDIGSLRLEVTP